jgi:hypothetical protein
MTAHNTDDGVAFSCDECGAVWKPPRLGRGSAKPDFQECLADAKDEGWRAIRVPSRIRGAMDWEHRCPKC